MLALLQSVPVRVDIVKSVVKKAFSGIGFDVRRLSDSPRHNALGLRKQGIRTVIDVGANTGQFARYILSVLPEAKVLCFEPLPGPFAELLEWARSIKASSVKAFNLALGESEGTVGMFQHLDHSPSSSLLHSTEVSHALYPLTKRELPVKVTMVSLDKFLWDSKLELVPEVLVKLDVQGYEDRVIRGAIETFRQAKSCVSEVNVERLYDGQCTFKDVWTLLDDLGYRYAGNLDQVYASDGHVVFADAMFMK